MHVIIAGCGRVGSLVAQMLSSEGHDVVVVDRDAASFERLGSAFNGHTVRGFEFDEEVLQTADIARADVFIASTNSDSANLMAAMVAKQVFGVERVVCRIYEPHHEYPFQRLGVATVAASALAALKIRNEVLAHGVWCDAALGAGTQMIRFRPTRGAAGRTVGEVQRDGELRIAAVLRGLDGSDAVIPGDDTVLAEHDLLVAVVRTDALGRLREKLGF